MSQNDDLGDRMKGYEAQETARKFLPGLPIYARIDGRGFSKFTKDMERPYDERMSRAMIETTKTLVDQCNATIGYTASDEISLVWIPTEHGHNWFDGKVMKMTSVLAGLATAAFGQAILLEFSNMHGLPLLQKMPHFDTRVISMPSEIEAANMLLWRNQDCAKNSITMAASSLYSHKELQGKNSANKHDMLFDKGINWSTDYPYFFKRGTFVRRRSVERLLAEHELNSIPEEYRPASNERVVRSTVDPYDLPPLSKIENLVPVLFKDADPVLRSG
jgi:tRNA(His) 5'-end guanylyltransferase